MVQLSGLPCPPDGYGLSDPQGLLQFNFVRLFVERARSVSPNLLPTRANAANLAQICRRLDGLPLALELAGARCNVITLREIAQRLDDRFHLLTAAGREEHPPRHQTLRAAIDWSYNLLTPPEQTLFRRLSVFAAGFSLTAAEEVCPGQGIERRQVLNLLSSLVNKSLVVAHTLQRDEARYQLLESVRQYAHEKLRDAGEENALRDRHLSCFLQLVEEAAVHQKEAGQTHWLERLQVEYSSIRSAMAWALESGKIEAGLRMTAVLRDYWSIHGLMDEGLSWTDRLLARAGEAVPALLRARVCINAAVMAASEGKDSLQARYAREALTLAEGLGAEGRPVLLEAIAHQGYAAHAAGDREAMQTFGARLMRMYRGLTEEDFRQRITIPFALTAMIIEDYQNAHLILENGIAALREAGEMTELADTMNILGDLYRCEQDYSRLNPPMKRASLSCGSWALSATWHPLCGTSDTPAFIRVRWSAQTSCSMRPCAFSKPIKIRTASANACSAMPPWRSQTACRGQQLAYSRPRFRLAAGGLP